jgi:sporulation-control protein
VFKRLLHSLGVGGPSVETLLTNPNVRPGGRLDGVVHLHGGDHPCDIEYVVLGLQTRVEGAGGDDGDWSQNQDFHRRPITGRFRLEPGERHDLPFRFEIPLETPITHVYGQALHGMTVGLHTELEIARAVDRSDHDPVAVHPLPAQQHILDGLSRLGFRFKQADLERGPVRGADQTLPFHQKIDFYPAARYTGSIDDLRLTFVATPHALQVHLEIDQRVEAPTEGDQHAGVPTEGDQDAAGFFTVDYDGAERTDWPRELDRWLRRSASRRGLPL